MYKEDDMPFFYWIGTMMSGVLLLSMDDVNRIIPVVLIAVGVIGLFSQLKQQQTRRP